jgi:hypothetical protein
MFAPKSTIAFPNKVGTTAGQLQSLKIASGQPRPGNQAPNAVLSPLGGNQTFPQHVTSVTAILKKTSDVSTKATVTFQRAPHDYLYVDSSVYVSGYQGNPQPVKIASGQSPISFSLNNTGESLAFTVQANGPTGPAPLSSAPTTTGKLVSTPLATTPTTGGTGVGITAFPAQAHKWLNSVTAVGVFSATQPSFADLTGAATAAQLPNPTASTLGGVESFAAVSHQWINTISTSGVPSATQPAFSDISGVATGAQLPNPSASTLGGIESFAAVSHQWINTISTSGVPSATQPAFSDISGIAAPTQLIYSDTFGNISKYMPLALGAMFFATDTHNFYLGTPGFGIGYVQIGDTTGVNQLLQAILNELRSLRLSNIALACQGNLHKPEDFNPEELASDPEFGIQGAPQA